MVSKCDRKPVLNLHLFHLLIQLVDYSLLGGVDVTGGASWMMTRHLVVGEGHFLLYHMLSNLEEKIDDGFILTCPDVCPIENLIVRLDLTLIYDDLEYIILYVLVCIQLISSIWRQMDIWYSVNYYAFNTTRHGFNLYNYKSSLELSFCKIIDLTFSM
jgi:hypothetical protein